MFRKKAENIFLLLGAQSLFFAVLLLLISCCFFAAGFPVNGSIAPLALALSVSACHFLFREEVKPVPFALASLLNIAGGIYLVLLTANYFDYTYDGKWYHSDAMQFLYNGWNPFYSYMPEKNSNSAFYINHYAQGVWFARGALYAFTNKIQSAKGLNLILMWSSFCFCFSTLLSFRKIAFVIAFLLSVILMLNPVALVQSFSNYIDGNMGAIFLVLLCALVLDFKKSKLVLQLAIAGSIIYLCNIKISGIVYALIVLFGYFLLLLFNGHSQRIKAFFVTNTLAFLIAILFVGFSSYVKNWVYFGHPFYPLYGEGAIHNECEDIIIPANFVGKSVVEKLNMQIFSIPEWGRSPARSRYKHLFVDFRERYDDNYTRADAELGGFGPVFAEYLIVLLILALFVFYKEQWKHIAVFLFVMLVLFSTILINPIGWFTRYIPHFFFIACLPLFMLFNTTNRVKNIAGILLLLILCRNAYSMSYSYSTNLTRLTNEVQKSFADIRSIQEKQPVELIFYFESYKRIFEENGISNYTRGTFIQPNQGGYEFLPGSNGRAGYKKLPPL